MPSLRKQKQSGNASIEAFGTITKSYNRSNDSFKVKPSTPAFTPSPSHKRKRTDASACDDNIDQTTPTKRVKHATLAETPTILFKQLQLDAFPAPLPSELQEVCRLHAAFLTALTMYYAHNGTTSPANIVSILPHITKTWKMRSVTIEDIRLLLGFGTSDFTLEDFGRAGICLVRTQPTTNRSSSYINEESTKTKFEQRLRQKWCEWKKHDSSPLNFLQNLQLSEIRQNSSVKNAAPIFARGHERLVDIKSSQAAAQAGASKPTSQLDEAQKSTVGVEKRNVKLLDRILAKQAIMASMPAGPTREQLERRAALNRIEDVARVLTIMALGGRSARISMSVTAVVQQLQQSLRNPISRDEAERCLALMSQEITPGFVKVVSTGNVHAVVLSRQAQFDIAQVRERVRVLLGWFVKG